MAFRFRLEKVLKHRRRLVDLQSRAVAEAAAVVAAIEGRLENQREAQRSAVEASAHAHEVVERQRYAHWVTHLEHRIKVLGEQRDEAQERLDQQRDQLQSAWRDREVLEQLRVRHHAEWQHEMRRRERADLDEIGQQRALARARQ